MAKILCITPNPAVDRTMIVPTLVPSAVHRSYDIVVDAGGKGLNVARAVQRLGETPICAGFLGGLSGQRVALLAAAEGLTDAWTQIADETLTCVIVATADGKEATVFNENGPTVTTAEWAQLIADATRQAAHCDLVCQSGSLPAGLPSESLPGLIRAVEEAGRPMWVDTSGASLRAALTAAPTMIKVNAHEAGEIAGQTIDSAADAVQVAAEFRAMGIRHVAITLGAQGAVLVDEDGQWWAAPPKLKTVSAVASGDCFMAGLAVAHTTGESWPHALKYAVAAGTANALSAGGARFAMKDFTQILSTIELHEVCVAR